MGAGQVRSVRTADAIIPTLVQRPSTWCSLEVRESLLSSTYVIAARLRLTKKATTAWLRAAFKAEGVISGRSPEVEVCSWPAPPRQVRHALGGALRRAADHQPEGIICARDGGAIWVYHMMVGRQPEAIATTLTALALAANFRSTRAVDHALFLEETSARLHPDGVLAVLEIGRGQARFVEGTDVKTVVQTLRPGEAIFFEALRMGFDVAATDARFVHPQVRQAARIAKESGARRLVLTHFSQRYPDVRAFYEEARQIHDDVVVVRDGDRVAVPKRR